jgi:hypothetical protein
MNISGLTWLALRVPKYKRPLVDIHAAIAVTP